MARKMSPWVGLGLGLLLFAGGAHAREVRVGLYDNPPKVSVDAQGQPSGIMGDLLRAIAKEEGWTLVPVTCRWEACLKAVETGDIDLLPDVARTDSRVRTFDFHQVPALHSWSQLYRRRSLPIESMLDLQGKRVAVLKGSSQQEYLSTLLSGFGLNTTFVPAASFDDAFARVAAGEADAVAANHHFGDMAAQRYKLEGTSLMFQPSRLFFVTTQGRNADLLAALDRHLNAWQAMPDSPYFQVLKRWAVQREAPPIPKAFWWGLGGLCTALLLALAFVALLKREVKRRTVALQASEDKLATILNSVDANIYIKDTELRYQYANQRVCDMLGKPWADVVGKSDAAFFDTATADLLRTTDQRVLLEGQRRVDEEVVRLSDNTQRAYLSVKIPLRRPDQSVYALCGISTDITEQRQFAQEIHQLAYHDPLTHLANRRQMLERLAKLQAQAQAQQSRSSQALLLLNVDGFKNFNDTHGHQTGDQLLQQVAQRLNACVRSGDLLARLGGDEFALLMHDLQNQPGLALRQVEAMASELLHALTNSPFQLGELSCPVTASIGLALLDPQAHGTDAVLKHADLALAQAKAAGRGMIRFFRSDMEAMLAARAAMESDLRAGLAQDQFLLYYQPQVDAHGWIFGVETLVRWQHPQRGLVSPGSFIGLAEVTGLIEPLGLWILRTACRQIRAWEDSAAHRHLLVAVNISARQLHHADFVQQVIAVLEETGANPQRLELELTESHLVEDIEGATAKLHALKRQGVRLSLDDFGTGYSSLNYLKRLPLDQLKIDQSFVRDLLIDANDLSIVKAIIDMGRNLGLDVLAEGVETQAQLDMLRQAGARRFQGYFFGHPVPPHQFHLHSPSSSLSVSENLS